MSKFNHLKSADVTILSSTEEQGRELLKVIEDMMMDYINYKPEKEDKESKND